MLSKDLTVRFVLVYAMPDDAHAQAARWIGDALSSGRLRHQVFRSFALDDVAAAHEATESMSNIGKVLVTTDRRVSQATAAGRSAGARRRR